MAISFEYLGRSECRCSWHQWIPDVRTADGFGIITKPACSCDEQLQAKVVQKPLTKNMYGSEFDSAPGKFMGLRCGQMRSPQLTHNSGWYNRAGEKIGWGDLDKYDFLRIRSALEDGELFVILGESDSFWNFVTRPGIIGSMSTVKPDVYAPGVEYIAEHAMYVITNEAIYSPSYSAKKEYTETSKYDGLTYTITTRRRIFEILGVPWDEERGKRMW